MTGWTWFDVEDLTEEKLIDIVHVYDSQVSWQTIIAYMQHKGITGIEIKNEFFNIQELNDDFCIQKFKFIPTDDCDRINMRLHVLYNFLYHWPIIDGGNSEEYVICPHTSPIIRGYATIFNTSTGGHIYAYRRLFKVIKNGNK